MSSEIVFCQVDAFTDDPFRGNPAAVVFLEQDPPDAWMQAVGNEMNLSETAFLRRRPDGEYGLRWFTPLREVDLCGHATLGSAHAIWESGAVPGDRAIGFHTRSGRLEARRRGEWIEMDFPSVPVAATPPPPGLLDALGAPALFVGVNRMDYLVEIESADAVLKLAPDLGRLAAVDARGTIVTARADGGGIDFVSRFFAPRFGVPEDPVTGSAHCALAPYWAAKLGKASMVGHQLSRRGGIVRVEARGDRVTLGGQAVTVLRGTLAASAVTADAPA